MPGYDVIMEVVLMEEILYQLVSVVNHGKSFPFCQALKRMSTGCRISHFSSNHGYGIMDGHDGTGIALYSA